MHRGTACALVTDSQFETANGVLVARYGLAHLPLLFPISAPLYLTFSFIFQLVCMCFCVQGQNFGLA